MRVALFAASLSLVASFPLTLNVTSALAQPIQITFDSNWDRFPDWTPDGQTIVFESGRAGTVRLYKVPAEGGTPVALSQPHAAFAAVSPDGATVAFCRHRRPDGIYTIPINGGPETLVSDLGGEWILNWTPDGQEIWYGTVGGNTNIYSVPAHGGVPTLRVGSNDNDGVPIFSPDGTKVAYTVSIGGVNNFVEAPISDPTNYTQLSFETQNTVALDYSLDGERILVTSRKNGFDLELFEYDRKKQTLTQITFDGQTTSVDPLCWGRYSPDGTRVVYSSRRGGTDHDIWILDLDPIQNPTNTLRIQDSQAIAGARVNVAVSLSNSQPIHAMEFKVNYPPDALYLEQIESLGAAGAMSATYTRKNDGFHCVLFSPAGAVIGPSESTILNLRFVVYPDFEGDSINLNLFDVLAAGGNSNEITLKTENGTMTLDRKIGDLTGDNRVDVLDLIRLTEVILGVTELETDELFEIADCSGDESINALDIPCFTEYILAGPSTIESGIPELWQIQTTHPVRGFQLTSERGHIYFDHPKFHSQTGTGLEGESILLAFSLDGSSWEPGGLATVSFVGEQPQVRAYGENNELLEVSYSERVIKISASQNRLRLLPPSPNPVRSLTTLSFEAIEEELVTLEVFDVQGARITRQRFMTEVGLNQTRWAARDETGRPLSSGVYFLRLKASNYEAASRLVVVGE